MYFLSVCEDKENMEVVDCEEQNTVCGADEAETCREFLDDGELSFMMLIPKNHPH